MNHRTSLVIAILTVVWIVTALTSLAGAGPKQYAVIGNTALESLIDKGKIENRIRQLYLKERTEWNGSIGAKPFNRSDGSDEEKAMREHLLGMSDAELAKHWISLKQKTGQTPPREVSSDTMVLKMVQKYDGAFGVLALDKAQAAADEGEVVILYTFP